MSPTEDLNELLDEVSAFVDRFVVFSSGAYLDAVTLWAVSTWLNPSAFDAWSYLAFVSPEKGSGKTRALEVLETLVARPWRTAMPSAPALFTKLEQDRPTLLLDEVDAVFNQKGDNAEALRGVLNAGNRRGGSVPRVVMSGSERRVVEFNVFGPKVLSGIASVPETLADRSIVIPMRRRKRGEEVEPFRTQVVWPQSAQLRESVSGVLSSKAGEVESWVRSFDHEDIRGLSDRQVEGWQPLLAVAGMAGPTWLKRAFSAAPEIARAQREADETAVGAKLLAHVRDAFETDRITTGDLLAKLRERDDGPWAEMFDATWDPFNQKSAARLAKMLKPYGVKPRHPRFAGGQQAAGYLSSDFADAWERWVR